MWSSHRRLCRKKIISMKNIIGKRKEELINKVNFWHFMKQIQNYGYTKGDFWWFFPLNCKVIFFCCGILRPFLNFMNCFKTFKANTIVALILDLWFKDLALVGDFIEHALIIWITNATLVNFLFPTLHDLY